MMTKVIKVKKVGEWSDYYREYYKNVETGLYYCKVEFRGETTWYTTDCNGGEPDCHVKKEIKFEIVE